MGQADSVLKKPEETKVEPEGPKVVVEIMVQAKDDGNVSVTIPEGSNIWVIQGIMAKALNAVCNLQIK